MASFGSVFCGMVARARFGDGAWSAFSLDPLGPLALHPGAHGLHYGSTCFEGLKAYRHADGSAHLFRLDQHVARMRHSARELMLPVPDEDQLVEMITALVAVVRDEIPATPGALYIRPLLVGTLPVVGAAAQPSPEAELLVMTCPVGDYFEGGIRPLRVAIEETRDRTAPGLGWVKTGANYAASLPTVRHAIGALRADQVLFAPGGDVRETGAANFLVIDDGVVRTRALDDTILHGVTRASVLELAPDLGLVVDESRLTVDTLIERAPHVEAALSGTAAVLAPVGTLLRGGHEHRVGSGELGPWTTRLRDALTQIQHGTAPDERGWLTRT